MKGGASVLLAFHTSTGIGLAAQPCSRWCSLMRRSRPCARLAHLRLIAARETGLNHRALIQPVLSFPELRIPPQSDQLKLFRNAAVRTRRVLP
jgi:hypothetical protein